MSESFIEIVRTIVETQAWSYRITRPYSLRHRKSFVFDIA